MNEWVDPTKISPVTQAAEGLPRRRWTVAEIERGVALGMFGENERFELIGGEIVPMSPKGNRHEVIKTALMMYWGQKRPPHIHFTQESTLRLTPEDIREPDFFFFPASMPLQEVKAETLLLAVEVADSSLAYDLGLKAKHYAGFGVREYWVINAKSLATTIHKGPSADGYATIKKHAAKTLLTPDFAPEMAVRLADLKL